MSFWLLYVAESCFSIFTIMDYSKILSIWQQCFQFLRAPRHLRCRAVNVVVLLVKKNKILLLKWLM